LRLLGFGEDIPRAGMSMTDGIVFTPGEPG
jgi:hypothetical protein